MVESISKLDAVVMSMGIVPTWVVVTSGFFTHARTQVIETIYKFDDYDGVRRGLLLDNDIVIKTPADELRNIILDVENKHLNIVGMYHNTNNHVLVFKNGVSLTHDEYEKLPQHDHVEYAGLGFYFGDLPRGYKFHMDADNGEDKYFFLENELDVRIEKRLKLAHSKVFTI